jgi:hypothetical protein
VNNKALANGQIATVTAAAGPPSSTAETAIIESNGAVQQQQTCEGANGSTAPVVEETKAKSVLQGKVRVYMPMSRTFPKNAIIN